MLDKMRENIIFLPSVQHTGTWFLIDFLRSHPDVNRLIEVNHLLINEDALPLDRKNILQTHMGTMRANEPRKHLNAVLTMALTSVCKTVIPLRDPLLSLITRQVRHPDMDHGYIVRGFEMMLELEKIPNTFFVPVDQNKPIIDRVKLLSDVLAHLGLMHHKYVRSYAKKWEAPTYNVTDPNDELKKYYHNRDFKKLRGRMTDVVDYLMMKSDVLRPFLAKHGYKDLLWW